MFRPDNYSVVLTTSINDASIITHHSLKKEIPEYHLIEKGMYEFGDGYTISFLNNVKETGYISD